MLLFFIVVFAISIVLGVESSFQHQNLESIRYKLSFSENRAFEGDVLRLVEEMHNNKFVPVPWIKAELFSSRWIEYAGTKSVISQDYRYVTSSYYLTSYQKVTRSWKLTCLKRGIFDINEVSLISGGIITKTKTARRINTNARLVVYPRPLDVDNFFVPLNMELGNVVVKRWIYDDPFLSAGAREYLPGDPMNRIHWNATAAAGQLMVRKNDYTSQISVCILYNAQEFENEYIFSTDKQNAETGIKAAAGLMDMVMKYGTPVRFVSNGRHPDDENSSIFTCSASGQSHGELIMDILARMDLHMITEFNKYLTEVKDSFSGEDVVVVSAYLNDDICDKLREYSRGWKSLSILVSNPYCDKTKLPDDLPVFVPEGRQNEH